MTRKSVKITDISNEGRISKLPFYRRPDFLMWLAGMVFSAILVGLIWGIGVARDWDAPSGFNHNTSRTSSERFLPEPFIPEPGVRGRDGPDAVGRWYYWKHKPERATVWTRLFTWVAYALHQILMWAVIYKAQFEKNLSTESKYSSDLSIFNWAAFSLNVVFHLLHLITTHTTYDGLAQDVTITSSTGSVIMLVTIIILMEYRERGLFFGWPAPEHHGKISKALRMQMSPINLLRRYHGYIFSWASIYTFWYHPMENTVGHVLGFFYTWILLLQGSLMFTKLHLNRYWRFLLETFALVHGGIVAYQTGGPSLNGTLLWPMFVYGFALTTVLTQLFGLPFWKKLPFWTRFIPLVLVAAAVVGGFAYITDKDGNRWVRIPEILRIPAVYYLFFFYIYLLLYIMIKIEQCCKKNRDSGSDLPPSATRQACFLILSLLCYVAMIAVSIAVEYIDVKMMMFVLMIIMVFIFSHFATVATILVDQAIPKRSLKKTEKISVHTINDPHDISPYTYDNEAFSNNDKM